MCGGGVYVPIWAIPLYLAASAPEAIAKKHRRRKQRKAMIKSRSKLSAPRNTLESVSTPGLFFHRALLQIGEGDLEEAEFELEQCLGLLRKGILMDQHVIGEAFILHLIGFTLDSLGKWDLAVDYLNRTETIVRGRKDGGAMLMTTSKHEFRQKSFTKPTFCCKCKMMLVGLTKQGLACKACNTAIHTSCAKEYDTPCPGSGKQQEKKKKKEERKEKKMDKKAAKERKKEEKKKSKNSFSSISDESTEEELTLECGTCKDEMGPEDPNAHQFEITDFRKPTFCSHCGRLLVGLTKQGYTCKKCDAVVHGKCIAMVSPCFESLESCDQRLTLSDVLGLRGLVYYHMSKYDVAIQDLEAALACQGEDFNETQRSAFIGNLGLAHYYQGEEDEALKLFNTAIDMGLEHDQLFSLRAVIHQLHGRNEEALSDRKRALMLSSTAQLTVFPYDLPPEIEAYVFTFLMDKDLANSSLVCKRWYALIEGNEEPQVAQSSVGTNAKKSLTEWEYDESGFEREKRLGTVL